jgi:hypothetical protein
VDKPAPRRAAEAKQPSGASRRAVEDVRPRTSRLGATVVIVAILATLAGAAWGLKPYVLDGAPVTGPAVGPSLSPATASGGTATPRASSTATAQAGAGVTPGSDASATSTTAASSTPIPTAVPPTHPATAEPGPDQAFCNAYYALEDAAYAANVALSQVTPEDLSAFEDKDNVRALTDTLITSMGSMVQALDNLGAANPPTSIIGAIGTAREGYAQVQAAFQTVDVDTTGWLLRLLDAADAGDAAVTSLVTPNMELIAAEGDARC